MNRHIGGTNTVERPEACQGENADARKATRAPGRVFKFPDSPESYSNHSPQNGN